MDVKRRSIKALLGLPLYATIGMILFYVLKSLIAGEIGWMDILIYCVGMAVCFIIQFIINT
ncbi:MAG: hypothetical protein RSC75_09660, partial [Bacteroidales bacterium]